MGEISTVGGGEEVTMEDKMDRGDGVGKVELLGGEVCLGSQSLACSVGERRWEVHLGVVTTDGRVSGDEE